jgi:CubicO group peptidase (beta-lactamase class C family)
MTALWKMVKWTVRLAVLAVVALGAWLYLSPPDLIRVATAYSAKIVCSNVFIAGRDAGKVLAEDVQAPGHPILKFVKVSVDENAGTVKAGLAGLFGNGLALKRQGFGCATVPDGNLGKAAAKLDAPDRAPADAAVLWPAGNLVAPSQDPAIAAILDDPALQGPGMRAIVVAQNGRIVGERYGTGFDAASPLLGWSMTKTVTAAIIGTLVRDGKLDLAKAGLFPEWNTDERAKITVADLMAMASGLEFNEDYGDVTDVTRMLYLEPDMAAFARDKPLSGEIGKVFNYSSGTTVLLSRIWQDALGGADAALSYPKQALFGPLGMGSAVMEADARGTYTGSSYLYATAHDWAKFAQMLVDGGTANGTQILPPEYVAMMREPVAVSDEGFGPQYGKGQLWLRGPSGTTPDGEDPDTGFVLPSDAFWMRGHDGQAICIIPSKRLVVLRMGLTPSKLNYKPQALVQRLIAVLP